MNTYQKMLFAGTMMLGVLIIATGPIAAATQAPGNNEGSLPKRTFTYLKSLIWSTPPKPDLYTNVYAKEAATLQSPAPRDLENSSMALAKLALAHIYCPVDQSSAPLLHAIINKQAKALSMPTPSIYVEKPMPSLSTLLKSAQGINQELVGEFYHSLNRYSSGTTTGPYYNNAAAFSLGDKQGCCVVGEGFLNKYNEQEVEAVVAHELGHIKGRHVEKSLALTGLTMYAGKKLANKMVCGPCKRIGLGLGLWATAGRALSAAYSRKTEKEADMVSARLVGPEGLISFFTKSQESMLHNDMDKIYTSHPTHEERIKYLSEYKAKSK